MMHGILEILVIVFALWALWLLALESGIFLLLFVLLNVNHAESMPSMAWLAKYKNNWNFPLAISIIALTVAINLLVAAVLYFVLIFAGVKPLPYWCGVVMFASAVFYFICAWRYKKIADRNKAMDKKE